MSIHQRLQNARTLGKKSLAILIDPDKVQLKSDLISLISKINTSSIDYILVGGSLLMHDHTKELIDVLKSHTSLPVVLFPGSPNQISGNADALLFLSVISGRNPDLLIGQQVIAAPIIKQLNLEAISTGYMLIDCGKSTSASYMSNTTPIPFNKPEIACATAIAGEMLGLQCIYMDGGSGADQPIAEEMIARVRKHTSLPLIIGGGIGSKEKISRAFNAGADVVVIGTAFENNPELIDQLAIAKVHE